MKKSRWGLFLTSSLVFLLLLTTACTTSVIKSSNPMFAATSDKNAAMVYLLRPTPIRTRGVADNDVKVEFGENQLVTELSSGEYVAFKVKPGNVDVITRSIAFITTHTQPEKVWRARNFDFKSGETYYIHVKFTQEEFRGMYFIPVEISKEEAQNMLIRIKPAGDLAKEKPII